MASKLQMAAKQRLAGRKEQFSDLLQGQLLCRVAMPLAVVWFAAAFMYYGQILIQTNMFAAEEAGERCPEYDVVDPQEPDDPDVCAELVSMVSIRQPPRTVLCVALHGLPSARSGLLSLCQPRTDD